METTTQATEGQEPADQPLKTYIGPYEVARTEELPDATLLRVYYTAEDGQPERWEDLNRDIYHATMSVDQSDLTTLRQKRMSKVAETILSVLTLFNVKVEEVSFLNNLIVESINRSLDRADGKLWKRPGETARDIHERTMRDIDTVLKAE